MMRVPDDGGATTIEHTGVYAVAACLAVSILLVAASAGASARDVFDRAVCLVTSLGVSDCGGRTSADEHRPTQPCVIAADTRAMRTEIAVIVVTASDGRRFEVAQLSDGRYRVKLLESGSTGFQVGVGGGLTVTVNDRTVGGAAVAEAGADFEVGSGRVWYSSDPDEVARMVGEDGEDAVEGALLGDSGPVRWVWERGQDVVGAATGGGDYEFPEADETFSQGGFSVGARGEITALTDRGSVSVGASEVLGVRETKQDETTIYYRTKVEGAAGLQWLNAGADGFDGADVAGAVELVAAVTYDADGAMKEVAVTGVAAGDSKGAIAALFGGADDASLTNSASGAVVYEATLPVRDALDERTASEFLVSMGVARLAGPTMPAAAAPLPGAGARLLRAAGERGYTTRQTYDTDASTTFAVDASGRLGIELGANMSVESETQTITGAQYWDGSSWVDRTECAG